MKVASYVRGGVVRPCLIAGEEVVDLGGTFASVRAIVELGGAALEMIETLREVQHLGTYSSVRLCAPLNPTNIFCVGWNYLSHFEERSRTQQEDLPTYPNFFSKPTGTVNEPYGGIPSHSHLSQQLDWEVELAVVIGKRGSDIGVDEALSFVFGYTVSNDLSARDLQRREGLQWWKGKSLDGTCPLGPWIVTSDHIPDPQSLAISSSVNGVRKQDANTSLMIFPIRELIHYLSQGMTLNPGDILLTGTPAGVGMAQDPPQFLGSGDVVECSIESIGTIRNQITE